MSRYDTATIISTRKSIMAVLLMAASLLLHGVNAGSYRRVVEARGTATVERNQRVYRILSDCYDIPLFDLCTSERIGSAYDCVSNVVPVPDCTGGANLTVTTIFSIGSSTLVTRS